MNVSLVVPVRDEADSILVFLESIAAQTRIPDEIIFVDGGSLDSTPEIIETWCNRWLPEQKVQIIRAGQANPGKGRNLGIEAATWEWIALTDAGIKLQPGWIAGLIGTAEKNPEAEVIYGNYEPVTDTFFTHCAALVYVSLKRQTPAGPVRGPSTASMLLQRRVWEAAGGFPDLRAAEDLIFFRKVDELGSVTAWSPDATVWWQLRPDLNSTFRKFVLYSRHNVLAGQQRYWHYGLVRYYLLSLPFMIAWLWHSYWWLTVPLLIFLARVAKNIFVRRESRGWLWLLDPVQFVMVAFIQAVIELATFIGWGQALWAGKDDPPQSTQSAQRGSSV